MPRVTVDGQVTVPREIRTELGIEPGDRVTFEKTDTGYVIRKVESTDPERHDPFERYRGSAGTDETVDERMRRLRDEYPRETATDATE